MSTLILVGRLGGDAELKTLQSGTQVCSFSVADDVGYGENKKTQWIKCAIFGTRAGKVCSYLTKGTMVEVIGRPQVNTWKDKQGEPRANIEVSVSDINLHGGGSKDRSVADNAPATQRDDMNQDIPF
jgi:single-strand DNA-binding protein